MGEVWKDIEGYNGIYEVSNYGRVRSWKKRVAKVPKMLKPGKDSGGYYTVALCRDGNPKTVYVHRLVAESFVPNPEDKPEVNHINGSKACNKSENLEWVTHGENIGHAIKSGLHNSKGENHYKSKLSERNVLKIRELYDTGNFTQQKIAELFGVGQYQISRIVNQKRWKHIQN